jgi:hypothetical protein
MALWRYLWQALPSKPLGTVWLRREHYLEPVPHTSLLPLSQPSPVGPIRSAAHPLGEFFPGDGLRIEDKKDAPKGWFVTLTRPADHVLWRLFRQEGFDAGLHISNSAGFIRAPRQKFYSIFNGSDRFY